MTISETQKLTALIQAAKDAAYVLECSDFQFTADKLRARAAEAEAVLRENELHQLINNNVVTPSETSPLILHMRAMDKIAKGTL